MQDPGLLGWHWPIEQRVPWEVQGNSHDAPEHVQVPRHSPEPHEGQSELITHWDMVVVVDVVVVVVDVVDPPPPSGIGAAKRFEINKLANKRTVIKTFFTLSHPLN